MKAKTKNRGLGYLLLGGLVLAYYSHLENADKRLSDSSNANVDDVSVAASSSRIEPATTNVKLVALQQNSNPILLPKQLVGAITAEFSNEAILIHGVTRDLPVGTKMWVEIIQLPGHGRVHGEGPKDTNVVIQEDSTFSAKISAWSGASFSSGMYLIRITSFFSSSWQTGEVLKKAGVTGLDGQGRSDVHTNPSAIPQSPDFRPDDPEFPKASRHLEAIREIQLGSMPTDQLAIAAVKDATLVVRGSGRSSLSVGKSVDFFASAPGFKPLTWSAVVEPNAKWTVTLRCIDGGTEKTAQWEYDTKTKSVKYLDPLAKTLSYVPPN